MAKKKIDIDELAKLVSFGDAIAKVTPLENNMYRVDWWKGDHLEGYMEFTLKGSNCHVDTLATQPKEGTSGIYVHLCHVWTHWLLDQGYTSITTQINIDRPAHGVASKTGFEVSEKHSEDFHTLKADISKKDNPLHLYGKSKA